MTHKKFTLRTAAKEAGVSAPTILRAIRSGRISAPKNDKGDYEIDPSELFRVFLPVTVEPHKEAPDVTVLQAKIENLETMLALQNESVKDLRERLNNSESERREVTQKLTYLLTQDLPKQEPAIEPTETTSAPVRQADVNGSGLPDVSEVKRKGWFGRLFSDE